MRTVKRYVPVFISIAIIILELLPYGAVLRFMTPPDSGKDIVNIMTYSYFDLIPFGYANVGPLLTAVISLVLLVCSIVYGISGKGIKAVLALAVIGCMTSLLPAVMFGIGYFSFVGACITVLFAIEIVLSAVYIKKDSK